MRTEAYSAGTKEPGIIMQARYSEIKSNQCLALWIHVWLKGLLLTYLSHDLTQRHLFEVGGFAAHVGPGDDDKVAALGDVAIVRHRLLSNHSLQNGMTALLDGQSVCELWAHWQTQQKKEQP